MRTPAGKDCRYFFGDYYRGRHREECSLLAAASPQLPWEPRLCETCPVPDILLANACQNMTLRPSLERQFPLIGKKQVRIRTYCSLSDKEGFDPHIGCGQCHPLPFVLPGENDESDASA